VWQVLGSEGIAHHGVVSEAALAGMHTHSDNELLLDELKKAQSLELASSADLTLEEVDSFLSHVLETRGSSTQQPANADVNESPRLSARRALHVRRGSRGSTDVAPF
jgi:hypothetical protein